MKKINKNKINKNNTNHIRETNFSIKSRYLKSLFKAKVTVQTESSQPRSSIKYCDLFTTPICSLVSLPFRAVQTVQQNVLPSILFTQGYEVLRKNFGFTREKLINDFLLLGMIGCAVSRIWVNPFFDNTQKQMNAIWSQVDNATIAEDDYNNDFYLALGSFVLSVGMQITIDIVNSFLKFLLNRSLLFKNQSEFVFEWLSNYSAYGLNSSTLSLDSENEKEKAELNPARLFESIKNQNAIIALWNSRITSTIDCATALYSLYAMSPPMALSCSLFSIILPKFLVLSLAYSASISLLLKIIEKPTSHFFERSNRLFDRILNQISHVDQNAELMTFLDGEKFEEKKLLELIEAQRQQALNYHVTSCIKYSLAEFFREVEWLFPMVIVLKNVREGSIDKKSAMTFSRQSARISKFFGWSNKNFKKIKKMESSVRRLDLYNQRLNSWKAKYLETAKRITNSETIQFSGSVYSDSTHKTLLAKGSFILPKGSITHISGPTGCGKTTLFRIFRGVWSDFSNCNGKEAKCSLPKEQSLFLPSQVRILGPEEPLFQSICYPNKFDNKDGNQTKNINLVKSILQELELNEHIYNNLTSLSLIENNKSKAFQAFKWMSSLSDGERKRIAFCNIILKLKAQEVKFLILDEPFKGVDFQKQKIMVRLLREAINEGNSAGCTVLFSNHEQNHGLNTHTLNITEDTKEYALSAVNPVKLCARKIG